MTVHRKRGGEGGKKSAGIPEFGGRACLVGKDWDHVGDPMWQYLGRGGAFKIIRDPDARVGWRSVNFSQADLAREEEWKLAPPLIPPRMIKDISWDNKKKRIPNYVHLTNDWELYFYGSLGEIPQGKQYDVVWFDEELLVEDWYGEVAVRGRVDRPGSIFQWSFSAQKATQTAIDLFHRSERPENKDLIQSFFMHVKDNPALTKEKKREFYESLSPAEREIRYEGKFAISQQNVYPEWSPYEEDERFGTKMWGHIVKSFPIPAEWTRYVAFDPGVEKAAATFIAVNDDPFEIHLYDEIYADRGSADVVAKIASNKMKFQMFEAFVIDHSAGRQGQMGAGISVEMSFERAFRAYNLKSYRTGYGFAPGTRDVRGREELLRTWLMQRPGNLPPVLRVHDRCRYFIWEMGRQNYRRAPDGRIVYDRVRRDNHLVTCLEYLAGYDPRPVTRKQKRARRQMSEYMQKKMRRQSRSRKSPLDSQPRQDLLGVR